MQDTTITTPGGDEILVLDDEAFASLTGLSYPSRSYSQTMKMSNARFDVLSTLWQHGSFEDASGRAAAKLVKAAGTDLNVTTAGSVMGSPTVGACLDRRVGAKRTYGVRLILMPERWASLMPTPEPVVEPEPVEVTPFEEEPLADVIEMPPPAPEPVPMATEMANAVATALLARVVEILATGGADGPKLAKALDELADASQRLYSQTEYAERLRRQRDEAGDQIAALKVEVDGLRRRLRETEHNLSVATGADAQRIIDAEVRRQLDKLMRQAPAGQHGA